MLHRGQSQQLWLLGDKFFIYGNPGVLTGFVWALALLLTWRHLFEIKARLEVT